MSRNQKAEKQEKFGSAEVNEIIDAATLFQKQNDDYSAEWDDEPFFGCGRAEVKMKTITANNKQVLVHPVTDMTMGGFENAYGDLLANFPSINEGGGNCDRLHIIPEVASGCLPCSRHIRLVVVEQKQDQSFEKAYENKHVFDPRGLRLGVQNTLDDTNCGRYVAAMTIQAAGLARDGFPVTKENLKASPAVRRALHFNLAKDAEEGLKNAYVKPLSKNPTPQEIIDHNLAKIKCLKSEYVSRVKNPDRTHHGTAICTAIFGGYVSSIFKAGYSAQEKLDAATEIGKAFLPNGNLDFAKLPKAARQGELGKCVDAILKAQEARAEFVKHGRFGL